MRNKIVLNSPRILEIKRKRHQILKRKILLIFSFVFLFLVGLSFLSRWQKINIKDMKVSGNKVLDSNAIEETIREDIQGNYLWFFPKTNVLFYPKGKIINDLTEKFKRIKTITVDVNSLNTLDVKLTERTGLFTYCGENIEQETNRKCYFLDQEGYVFDEAPYFSGDVYLKLYGKISDSDDPSGNYFFKPIFKNLITFKETIENMGIKPVAFLIGDDGDIRMVLHATGTGEGPQVIFKSDADFAKIAENFQSVLSTDPLQTDFKNKYSTLSYIDLRFGNKVYYKFK